MLIVDREIGVFPSLFSAFPPYFLLLAVSSSLSHPVGVSNGLACPLSPDYQNKGSHELVVISKDRHAEARETLRRLNDDHEDPTFWEKEYIQISAQLAIEKKEVESSSWIHMLTNRKELHRVAVAVAALVSVQTIGAQVIQVFQVGHIPRPLEI